MLVRVRRVWHINLLPPMCVRRGKSRKVSDLTTKGKCWCNHSILNENDKKITISTDEHTALEDGLTLAGDMSVQSSEKSYHTKVIHKPINKELRCVCFCTYDIKQCVDPFIDTHVRRKLYWMDRNRKVTSVLFIQCLASWLITTMSPGTELRS